MTSAGAWSRAEVFYSHYNKKCIILYWLILSHVFVFSPFLLNFSSSCILYFSLHHRVLPLPPPPPPQSLLFLLHPHFPRCAPSSSSSASSVRRSAAMVDSPGAMKKTFSVPEIKPLDQYDFNRAKTCASVRWLLSKSYGSAGRPPPGPAVLSAEAPLGWGA